MARRPKANPVIRKAATLTPFRQGQFDTLCALYAALNAVQLLRPTSPPRAQAVFNKAIAHLRTHHRRLNPVTQGLSCRHMHQLVEYVVTTASTGRVKLKTELPGSTPLGDWIEHRLTNGGPVIACLIPRAHFTVITAISRAGPTLFDSQGMSWVPLGPRDRLCEVIDVDGVAGVQCTLLPHD
jgi:hypothetical protein